MNDDEVELVAGSGNPFIDLDSPDAIAKTVKAQLAGDIIGVLDARKLSTRAAGKLVGLDQADIVRIRNADLSRFTVDRLIVVLAKLDRRVDVTISDLESGNAAA